jgi:hypothetical protein
MGWGCSITGDSTKDALCFPLEVTSGFVVMLSISSGVEDGEGLEFWMDFVLVWLQEPWPVLEEVVTWGLVCYH